MASRDPELGRNTLVDLRDAVIGTLRGQFPKSVNLIKHRAAWTVDALKEYSRRSPAIIVTMVGGDAARRTAVARGGVTMAIAVMVRTLQAASGDHDDPAAVLMAKLLSFVPDQDWGETELGSLCVGGATEVEWSNDSQRFVGLGVNVYSMTWVQPEVPFPLMTEEEIERTLAPFLLASTDFTPAEAGPDDPIQDNLVKVREP